MVAQTTRASLMAVPPRRRPTTRPLWRNPTPLQQEEQAWDEALHSAHQIAKTQGRAPAAVTELIREAHRSEIEWRDLLAQFMTATGKADYSWAQPNRRYVAQGVYLPSLRSDAMPPVVFAVDTSGSMDTAVLADVWAEVRAIALDLQPASVVVVQCAEHVHSVEEYDPHDLPDDLDIRQRGGTAYTPAFDAIDELELPEDPACIVYLTDLECDDYPNRPAAYPVFWAAYDYTNRPDHVRAKRTPPFGDLVEVS